MLTKVWHAKKPTFGFSQLKFPDDYELVAELDTDSLEVAFEKTNTIAYPWWDNEGLIVHKRTRSTSVGDVVEMNGKFYLCEMAGWTAIVPNRS